MVEFKGEVVQSNRDSEDVDGNIMVHTNKSYCNSCLCKASELCDLRFEQELVDGANEPSIPSAHLHQIGEASALPCRICSALPIRASTPVSVVNLMPKSTLGTRTVNFTRCNTLRS